MDGFKQSYKQIQSFGLSSEPLGNDFPNRNKFPRYDANGSFKLEGAIKSNTENKTSLNYQSFGSLAAGADKYFGGTLAPNGIIYCSPMSSNNIGKINTINDTFSTGPTTTSGSVMWLGNCLAGNFVVHAPFSASNILLLNWSNESISYVGNFTGSNKYAGCVYAPNGWVYFIPYDATQFCKYNPLTNQIIFFGTYSGTAKHVGGALYGDKIIMAPYSGSNVCVFDTSTDSYQLINYSFASSSQKFQGLAIYNRWAYFVPHNAHQSLYKFNCDTYELKLIGFITSLVGYAGPCVGADGNIYCLPFQVNQFNAFKLNTNDDSFTETTVYSGIIEKWRGNVLAQNGKIYGIPEDVTFCATLCESIPGGLNPDFVLNRTFNKF